VKFRTKAGRLRNILWSAEVMDFGGLKCILGVGRDITQYKYLENELQRSQRMEALGRLAGSIAHDFNNLLTAIDGFCDLILLRIDNRESVAKSIGKIKGVKSSASSLIRQLLSFSRKQPIVPKDVNLNEVIMSMQDLLLSVMGAKNDLRLVLDQKSCHVLADRSQLEQVIMNLSLNARDAMPRGGTFTLATSRVRIDEESADSYIDLTPGDYVRMIVTDTGNGMDEETASHVFEPFFTTKEDGKGSGLGLTTVYSIVKQSGGSIRLRTEPGKGAIFTIFIPCLKEAGLAPRARTINQVRNSAKDKDRSR
jgi:two-component system cell cycle sensor histidine kinase/response regulator CckA